MNRVANFFEVLTVLGALVGGYMMLVTIGGAADHQGSDVSIAAGSAFAVAMVALPYCLAGVFHRWEVRRIMLEDRER